MATIRSHHTRRIHSPTSSRRALITLLSLAFAAAAAAEVRLPAIIGDGMVLQQKTEAPIWGWADPGQTVRVIPGWDAEPVMTTADKQGAWRVRVSTPEAGGPHTLTIAADNATTLSDVWIGEVWVCSGQSNMQWPLTRVDNAEKEIADANFPQIRLFNVKRTFAAAPREDCEGQWVACSPQSAREFSAVAYFFGRELHRKLGVPIGLIGSNWGGTLAEAWTSEKSLRTMGDFDAQLADLAAELKTPGHLAKQHAKALKRWWAELANKDAGSKNAAWASADFDHSAWKTRKIPSAWQSDDLKKFDGVVWLRTIVDLPPEWSAIDLTLALGPIDDMDTVWFNGTKVGGLEQSGRRRNPRNYTVPAAASRSGDNVLAVRVLDTGGGGGLQGQAKQLKLYPKGGDGREALWLAGEWSYQLGAKLADLRPWPRAGRLHQNWPTALHNGMITPLIPYAIRGAIWYQGESNRTRGRQYRKLFPLMIRDWRQTWGQGDFPFYYVQIAPFGYARDNGQAAELREAQMMTLAVPNTGMAVTMDIGNPRNIHPKNKQEVGRRLSLWALAKTYGQKNLVYSGPAYKSMRVGPDGISLTFEHVGGGLKSTDGGLTHFTIAGQDRVFHAATAWIEGDTVKIPSSSTTPHPVAVRYAWGAADEPNLRNKEGLPASSFRTDDWPREPLTKSRD